MSDVVAVRAATPADGDAVVGLEDGCLGADAWPRGLVEEGLAGTLPTVRYLVADDAVDGVVGHAVVSVAGDIAELQRIAVAPSWRRRGVATSLLAAVQDAGRGGGADRLLLEVRAENAGALGFYARSGFVEIDRRPRYYRDGSTAVVMRLPLIKGCG
ncbi:GNAT family N-acetyltransferase [Nocardioides terrisoli]|uniref:GNAT family N-acetyltransferase n=1 Tax=Nocardioides terrisoli TaxID=3388267 RepID=UPI00287BBF10|nr:GNAT family N-acetyltransferase [Nocardioides marmorisolisilvae]